MKRMLAVLVGAVITAMGVSYNPVWAAESTVTDNQSWSGEKAFNVPAGDVVTYSGTFTSSGTLVKTGEGKMVISSGNSTTFTGNVRIEGGTLALPSGCVAAMYKSGEIRVEKGATLDISSTADSTGNTMFDQGRKLFLAGSGVDGVGALVRTTGGDREKLLGMIELTDDAVISINASYTSRRELTLNGHTLTVKGGGRLGFDGSTFTADKEGDIAVTQGSFLLQNVVTLNGSSSNTISIPDGGYLYLSNTGIDNALGWSFVLNGSAYFRYRDTLITGGLTLNGDTATFRPNEAGRTLKLDGPVSGVGRITPYDSTTASALYLNNANNTFSGGVTWKCGELHLASAGSLPGYGKSGTLQVGSNASLYLSCGDSASAGTSGWKSSEVVSLLSKANLGSTMPLWFVTEQADVDFTYEGAVSRALSHKGAGTLRTVGAITAAMNNAGGNWIVGGAIAHTPGALTVTTGEISFADAGTVDFGANVQTANGVMDEDAPVVSFKGATTVTANDLDGSSRHLYPRTVAGTLAGQQGLIRVESGANVTSHFQLGNAGVGALHQLGGTSAWYGGRNNSGNSSYSALVGMSTDANKAYGYLGVAGGSLNLEGYTVIGYGANAVGVVSVKGKNTTITETSTSNTTGIFAGREGGTVAVYAGNGGTLTYPGERIYVDDDAKGGSAVFTSTGADSKILTKHFQVTGIAGSVFMANMNEGGVFELGTFRLNGSDGKYYLNFNGGGVNCTQNAFIYAGDGYVEPTAMTIYEKGATFNLAADSPLLAPTGKSVKSIALPDEVASEKYLGAYPVTISGKGQGASAIADYDEATRTVKGIIVTSPGFGYDDATTATIESADRSKTYVCAVTLEDAKSGPLVKKGVGQLRLSAGNTYAGPTTIAEGEMLFEANAVNADHTVVVEEGTILRLGADTVLGSISGCGEIFHTSTGGDTLTLSSGVIVRAADLAAKRSLTVRGKLVFAAGAGITFDDDAAAELIKKGGIVLTTTEGIIGTPVVTGLPNGWRASVTADGKSLRLSTGGLIFVVR